MNEIWIRWQPISGLKVHYYIVSITDNEQGFEIILEPMRNTDKNVKIRFIESIVSYRLVDESYAADLIPTNEMREDPTTPWCFFRVENSRYLKWFIDTSLGMVEIYGQTKAFIHFSIITLDSVIDVISLSEPVVEFED